MKLLRYWLIAFLSAAVLVLPGTALAAPTIAHPLLRGDVSSAPPGLRPSTAPQTQAITRVLDAQTCANLKPSHPDLASSNCTVSTVLTVGTLAGGLNASAASGASHLRPMSRSRYYACNNGYYCSWAEVYTCSGTWPNCSLWQDKVHEDFEWNTIRVYSQDGAPGAMCSQSHTVGFSLDHNPPWGWCGNSNNGTASFSAGDNFEVCAGAGYQSCYDYYQRMHVDPYGFVKVDGSFGAGYPKCKTPDNSCV